MVAVTTTLAEETRSVMKRASTPTSAARLERRARMASAPKSETSPVSVKVAVVICSYLPPGVSGGGDGGGDAGGLST